MYDSNGVCAAQKQPLAEMHIGDRVCANPRVRLGEDVRQPQKQLAAAEDASAKEEAAAAQAELAVCQKELATVQGDLEAWLKEWYTHIIIPCSCLAHEARD